MIKTCEYCGLQFNAHHSTQKYCCKSCSSKAAAEKGIKLKKRTCKNCNKLYIPNSNTQEWCNDCLTKTCEWCGKPFRMVSKSHVNRAKYCSVECRQKAYAQKMIGVNAGNYRNGQRMKTIEKTCEICKKPYLIDPAHEKENNCCSEECMRKWRSKHFIGENSTNWKGGISGERHMDMQRTEYRNWRNEVFERDNYTCQLCGDNTGGNLQAHHIKPYSEFPELRYDINNGITLCETCHRNIHKKQV